jgi:hypothetical protein
MESIPFAVALVVLVAIVTLAVYSIVKVKIESTNRFYQLRDPVAERVEVICEALMSEEHKKSLIELALSSPYFYSEKAFPEIVKAMQDLEYWPVNGVKADTAESVGAQNMYAYLKNKMIGK